MITVLYRWKIKEGFEVQFIDAWTEITEFIVKNYDSLGSRLHQDDEGVFYGYAQWESIQTRAKVFGQMTEFEAREKFRDAIAETLPEIILTPIIDFLIFPTKL